MAAERPCMNIGPDCLRFEIWNEFVTFHNKMVICSCKGATVVGGGGGGGCRGDAEVAAASGDKWITILAQKQLHEIK